MIHITEILNNFILENVITDFEIIYNDVFPEDKCDCLISRYEPSEAKETEYIDGSAVGSVQIGYLLRSSDASKCRKVLNEIIERIDNISCKTEEGLEIRFSAVTLPNFISIDEKQQVIYSATIKAEYTRPLEEN